MREHGQNRWYIYRMLYKRIVFFLMSIKLWERICTIGLFKKYSKLSSFEATWFGSHFLGTLSNFDFRMEILEMYSHVNTAIPSALSMDHLWYLPWLFSLASLTGLWYCLSSLSFFFKFCGSGFVLLRTFGFVCWILLLFYLCHARDSTYSMALHWYLVSSFYISSLDSMLFWRKR